MNDGPEYASNGRLVATGIPGLEDIVGGGFTADRVYLVEGNPGSGKTTLALQYLLEGVRLGEAVIYVTLSETANELHESTIREFWIDGGIKVGDPLTNFHGVLRGVPLILSDPATAPLAKE